MTENEKKIHEKAVSLQEELMKEIDDSLYTGVLNPKIAELRKKLEKTQEACEHTLIVEGVCACCLKNF